MYISNASTGLPPGINAADQTAYNPATNRLNTTDPGPSHQTASYDNNGNLMSVGTSGGTTTSVHVGDAENRQVSFG